MALEVVQIPVLEDNYVYLAHDQETQTTAVVDPAVADRVLEVLDERGWKLNFILNTHHHWDHVGGNLELKKKTNCQVVGFGPDASRIDGIDIQLEEGDFFDLGQSKAEVIFVPGHTLGHIAYYFKEDKVLFCGDTLFAMGCGRLFEGTPEQMWTSLKKIRALPDDVSAYCAHEYTLANGQFALTVEPNNTDLQTRMAKTKERRQKNLPTVPSLLGDERATNPFLRADIPEFASALGLPQADPEKVFAETRLRKDVF